MFEWTGKGIKIGRFEYSANISAILLLWIAVSAFEGFSTAIADGAWWGYPLCIVLGVSLIISLLLHEAGHAYTAVALGVPIGGIRLFALGGMAMMTDRPRSAKQEFLIAIAGPVVSALLWFFLSIPMFLGGDGSISKCMAKLAFYNLIIAIFNMVPAFPLDGGRVFRSIAWFVCRNVVLATKIAVRLSEAIVALYLLFSFWHIAEVGAGIIWNVVLGLFVCLAGEMELRALQKESQFE